MVAYKGRQSGLSPCGWREGVGTPAGALQGIPGFVSAVGSKRCDCTQLWGGARIPTASPLFAASPRNDNEVFNAESNVSFRGFVTDMCHSALRPEVWHILCCRGGSVTRPGQVLNLPLQVVYKDIDEQTSTSLIYATYLRDRTLD